MILSRSLKVQWQVEKEHCLFSDLLVDVESSVVRETKGRHSNWKEKKIKIQHRKLLWHKI